MVNTWPTCSYITVLSRSSAMTAKIWWCISRWRNDLDMDASFIILCCSYLCVRHSDSRDNNRSLNGLIHWLYRRCLHFLPMHKSETKISSMTGPDFLYISIDISLSLIKPTFLRSFPQVSPLHSRTDSFRHSKDLVSLWWSRHFVNTVWGLVFRVRLCSREFELKCLHPSSQLRS